MMRNWPELPYSEWRDTCLTVQRFLQIAGKLRLRRSPWVNHSWSSTFYVSSHGLTSSLVPAKAGEDGQAFSMSFDFLKHRFSISKTSGEQRSFELRPESVADFYGRFRNALTELGVESQIDRFPNETVDRIPFDQDHEHRSYDRERVEAFWHALVSVDLVLSEFRSRFLGKCSPVHFFWGAMDLAVTRFSGRRAPRHPGGVPNLPDDVTREAYSHEVSSCGFWPGNDVFPQAAFYSYAYPQPARFEKARVIPQEAYFHSQLREFILPYDSVRRSSDPKAALLGFLQSTYEAAADLGGWDRDLLETSQYLAVLQRKQKTGEQGGRPKAA